MTQEFIEVLKGGGEGFWEIDTDKGRALFREHGTKRPTGTKLHDYHEIYTTVEQYIREKLGIKHVKEIIPGAKYMFSDNIFCSWQTTGMVATDPAFVWHCTKEAHVYKNGKHLCMQHAHVNF